MAKNYDVAVVGSGPGGYVAGIKAAQHGLKAVVVEKERLGGVCLNWGCIPTKALLRDAELYELLRDSRATGISATSLSFDPSRVVARSRKIADKMNKGVASLFRKYKVDHLIGTARLLGGGRLAVTVSGGRAEEIAARDIIIATGAKARSLPTLTPDGHTVITYREALELKELPKKMLIIGAGPIGVEFAYYFHAFGVEVHLVELLARLLPQEDAEISEVLLRSFRKRGIACYPATAVESIKVKKGRVEAELKGAKEGTSLTTDIALVAVGMTANTDELDLPAAGLRLDNGFLKTDRAMRTGQEHLYAIGDVAGRQLLAHKASAEAEVVVAAITGNPARPLEYGQIPACTYCQPQVASIGLSEATCKEQGLQFRVGRFPFAASGKANAIGQLEGLAKLIFGEPHGQLLGAHLIGPEVTELIAELGLAMRLEATHEEILATIHAHPTLSEILFEATGAAYGVSANI